MNLSANATSMLPGTVVNLDASPGASLTMNSPTATALGAFSQINMSGSSTLSLGVSQSFASLNGSGSITSSATTILTLGNVPGGTPPNSVFSGTISGANLSLIKTSNSALTLGGANTYGGGTTVSSGSLILANSTGSATGTGSVATQLGTTLGGSGSIVAEAGKSILIGGALNVGNNATAAEISLTTSGIGLLSFDINSALMLDLFSGAGLGDNTLQASAADMLSVGGQLSILEGSRLILGNPNSMSSWAAGDQWRLFDWTSLSAPVSGTFDRMDFPTLPSDLAWDFSDLYIGGTVIISPVIVPEPGRAFLAGLGLLLLLLRRRRGRNELDFGKAQGGAGWGKRSVFHDGGLRTGVRYLRGAGQKFRAEVGRAKSSSIPCDDDLHGAIETQSDADVNPTRFPSPPGEYQCTFS